MDDFIARENIKRFRAQLSSSSDDEHKAVLRALLEAEQHKLEQARQAKRTGGSSR